ncbi:MAG: ABC transporter permease [Chloroflexi bacterium]|nr:ABC transporter permease [Chloroflexota bacterium]
MIQLISRRLSQDRRLLLAIFVGITIASILAVGAPIYVQSLNEISLSVSIERSDRHSLRVWTLAPFIAVRRDAINETDRSLDAAISRNIAEIEGDIVRFFKTEEMLVGLPDLPLPETGRPSDFTPRGFFQTLSDVEPQLEFIEGRWVTGVIEQGPYGPIVEGVMDETLATFFGLETNDVVTFAQAIGSTDRLQVRVVGIVQPKDLTDDYWPRGVNIFGPATGAGPSLLDFEQLIDSEAIEAGLLDEDDIDTLVEVFIHPSAVVDAIGQTFPATFSSINYFMHVHKPDLQEWTVADARARLNNYERDLVETISGASMVTGISDVLDVHERRRFFSMIPILLLIAVMLAVVLYYLFMMVGYLLEAREDDRAALRTCGAGRVHLLRVYALEGLALTLLPVLFAPFLAYVAVALSGTLPYFDEFTGGGTLPVRLNYVPFVVALGVGILCLGIFVVPSVISSRSSVIAQKLRASRPTSAPFFQRYFLDVGLIALGGLLFWELNARGHFVTGGLFEEIQVNETMLLAPAVFLIAVALIFMRAFPLFIRYVSGESSMLVHWLTTMTVASLPVLVIWRDSQTDETTDWPLQVAILATFGIAYWATTRVTRVIERLIGISAQVALVALFIWQHPPDQEDLILFVPILLLVAIVPLQLGFYVLRWLSAITPVVLELPMMHMSRNPLQYSWMILLLVLLTGLGVLATTVGSTLGESQHDRARYSVGADIHISGIEFDQFAHPQDWSRPFEETLGVENASFGFRSLGQIGPDSEREIFEILAVEPERFSEVGWFRNDFADHSLNSLMDSLLPTTPFEAIPIPDDAEGIGVWAKPEGSYQSLLVLFLVMDQRQVVTALPVGSPFDPTKWQLLSTLIPEDIPRPLHFLGMLTFEQGVFGSAGITGSILLNDLHAAGPDGIEIIEPFDGDMTWSPFRVADSGTDSITYIDDGSFQGGVSAVYRFGQETYLGKRGLHLLPEGGHVPVLVSSSFAEANGVEPGDSFVTTIQSRAVPVVVGDVVDYFPTLSPSRPGFMVADLWALTTYLDMIDPGARHMPTELFVRTVTGQQQTALAALSALVDTPVLINSVMQEVDRSDVDPLVTAGWRVMIPISAGVIVLVLALGYVVYLISFAGRARVEMSALRAMGLSRAQLASLLTIEHIFIALVGIGLGSWAGFQMSRLMVTSLEVSEEGEEILPPFLLLTDWAYIVPVYALMIAVVIVALLNLNRGFGRLELHEVMKNE